MVLHGEVVQGARVASGLHEPERPNATGTIELQRPFFVSAGIQHAQNWFTGTINIRIAPREFHILKPDYVIEARWLPGVVETFWLVAVILQHRGRVYPAYIYYPCPSPLKAHPNTLLEVLSEKIDAMRYGDRAVIWIPDGKIELC
jgi:hypothetical protein